MSLLSKHINRQLAAYQSELVQTHYQEVENMYRQIRGWRHDYRNHIQVLKSYAKDGDLAQISKYLDELDEDLSTVDTVIKTGNKMTDAILNSKISLAKSKHIPVVADAHVPVALKTSEMDLCIIIGNLLFGLVRIDDIVERYGGYLSRNSEDGAFTTEILLPQE